MAANNEMARLTNMSFADLVDEIAELKRRLRLAEEVHKMRKRFGERVEEKPTEPQEKPAQVSPAGHVQYVQR